MPQCHRQLARRRSRRTRLPCTPALLRQAGPPTTNTPTTPTHTQVAANGGLAPGSPPLCAAASLISPCTARFSVRRGAGDTLYIRPSTSVLVGPGAGGCPLSHCQVGAAAVLQRVVAAAELRRATVTQRQARAAGGGSVWQPGCTTSHAAARLLLPCPIQGGVAQLAWAGPRRRPVCTATGTFYDRSSGAPTLPVSIYETRSHGRTGQRLVAVQVTVSTAPSLACTLLYTAPDAVIDTVLRCPKRPHW